MARSSGVEPASLPGRGDKGPITDICPLTGFPERTRDRTEYSRLNFLLVSFSVTAVRSHLRAKPLGQRSKVG